MSERLFKACAYCGLTRLCSFYGRRWLCDYCQAECDFEAALDAAYADEGSEEDRP